MRDKGVRGEVRSETAKANEHRQTRQATQTGWISQKHPNLDQTGRDVRSIVTVMPAVVRIFLRNPGAAVAQPRAYAARACTQRRASRTLVVIGNVVKPSEPDVHGCVVSWYVWAHLCSPDSNHCSESGCLRTASAATRACSFRRRYKAGAHDLHVTRCQGGGSLPRMPARRCRHPHLARSGSCPGRW